MYKNIEESDEVDGSIFLQYIDNYDALINVISDKGCVEN